MKRLPLPGSVVMAFAFGSMALLMASGVRVGVNRKARTPFAGAAFIEDSKAGAAAPPRAGGRDGTAGSRAGAAACVLQRRRRLRRRPGGAAPRAAAARGEARAPQPPPPQAQPQPPPPVSPAVTRRHPGNQTRYRVVTRSEDTGGESFTVELLIREGAWGAARGAHGAFSGGGRGARPRAAGRVRRGGRRSGLRPARAPGVTPRRRPLHSGPRRQAGLAAGAPAP
jgi:hypothetical protein